MFSKVPLISKILWSIIIRECWSYHYKFFYKNYILAYKTEYQPEFKGTLLANAKSLTLTLLLVINILWKAPLSNSRVGKKSHHWLCKVMTLDTFHLPETYESKHSQSQGMLWASFFPTTLKVPKLSLCILASILIKMERLRTISNLYLLGHYLSYREMET